MGTRVAITCQSKTKARFTKDGKNVNSMYQVKNSLVFQEVTQEDRGIYLCNGSGSQGNFEASSQLLVGGQN